MMPLAALLLGSVAAALPAAAAQPERGQRIATAAQAQDESVRAKADKPLVMLVCRETRSQGRSAGARAADLTCSTRWAGF
jgi:hypothetical protein